MIRKSGFTLIELLLVIVILTMTTTLIVVNINKNVKDVKSLATNIQISNIESSAYLLYNDYKEELTTINTTNIESISLSKLVTLGLLKNSDVENLDLNNVVLIVKINDKIKIKYDPLQNNNLIFINGLEEITIHVGETYIEQGGYVVLDGSSIEELSTSNIISNVNTAEIGNYTVTYNYSNSSSVTRKVKVI